MDDKIPLPPALRRFAGNWRLTRRIRHADGAVWSFGGQAVFTPDGAGLDWRETGRLTGPGGAAMEATRRYRMEVLGDGVLVLFDDGRPFHVIGHVIGADARADHDCPPDTYRVRYRFRPDRWASLWQVSGPRKAYRMTSLYRRAG